MTSLVLKILSPRKEEQLCVCNYHIFIQLLTYLLVKKNKQNSKLYRGELTILNLVLVSNI